MSDLDIRSLDILAAVGDIAGAAGANTLDLDIVYNHLQDKIDKWEGEYPIGLLMERELVTRQKMGLTEFENLIAEFDGMWEAAAVAIFDDRTFDGWLTTEVFAALWVGLFRSGTLIGLSYVPKHALRTVVHQAVGLIAAYGI